MTRIEFRKDFWSMGTTTAWEYNGQRRIKPDEDEAIFFKLDFIAQIFGNIKDIIDKLLIYSLCQSSDIIIVEDNHYFPPESLDMQYFTASDTTTECPWKGTAHYYKVIVNGEENPDAAWYYPEPSDMAKGIKGRVAFWKGVSVES